MPGLVPPSATESECLLAYLAQQRYVVRIASYGLTDLQAAASASPSALTISGLIKHLAAVERFWISIVEAALKDAAPAGSPGSQNSPASPDSQDASAGAETDENDSEGWDSYQSQFVLGPGETLESVLADYDAAAAETEEVVRKFSDLGHAVPVPPGVPWFPGDVDAWSVRWVVLHLIEETARHAGHADIVREAIDGATAFPLIAAVEDWPATPWLQPWKASVSA